MDNGIIYLIPCPLGDDSPLDSIPQHTLSVVRELQHFVVENAKSARHFVKGCEHPQAIRELTFDILDKKTDPLLIPEIIAPCFTGVSIGVISEAGCPGIADPGSELINYAHLKGIKVVPLIGPSSILQALMASGFNGQKFAFHGYLPKNTDDLKRKIKSFEKHIRDFRQTQLFIETPYRTNQLVKHIVSFAGNDLKLCIAANINQIDESIITKTIAEWKKSLPEFGKSPAVFLLYN
ncbi:MAG: 16S rRNA (cytidine1402-2'-O)-methyltransferase [Saprospiraceae bacterium]|jgi:16S rRNA (cytidine1402-2'-O)-methyltransferase